MLIIFIITYAIALAIFITVVSSKRINLFERSKKHEEDGETLVLALIISGFIIGILVIIYLSNQNLFLLKVNHQDYSTLLSTSATIIGTILAVSFSILILGLQHALSRYSPSLLRYFVIEKASITCFVILSLSAVTCLLGLISPWREFMVPLSLFLLSYSFFVLGYYYIIKSNTSTTISLFKKLRSDGQKYISNRLVKKFSPMIKNFSGNQEQRRIYLQVITISLFNNSKIFEPVQNQIDEIIGLIHNCLHNNDYQSVKFGLETICDVIKYYMDKRIGHPPDKLIESLYAQIDTVTVMAVEKNNTFVLTNIVKAYEKLGVLGIEDAT